MTTHSRSAILSRRGGQLAALVVLLVCAMAAASAAAYGAAAGLEVVDAIAQERTLARYHLLPAVRGDLLERLGRHEEARGEFARAASLATNARDRAIMLQRASQASLTRAAEATPSRR